MKKKIYLAMAAACLALTVAGCGESGKTGTDTAETQENTDGKTAEAGVSRLVSVDNVDKYITLGEYKGLILDNTVEVITDDDVQARIDQELQDKAEAVSDGAQEGDLVTVNYVGTIDGETFDGGTANNYDFIIGNQGRKCNALPPLLFCRTAKKPLTLRQGSTDFLCIQYKYRKDFYSATARCLPPAVPAFAFPAPCWFPFPAARCSAWPKPARSAVRCFPPVPVPA